MNEQWKDIKGYEGIYQVSNLGNVKALERDVKYKNGNVCHYKEKILKTRTDKKGYMMISLNKNNKRKNFNIHRLVAEAFISNPDNKPTVDHINTLKSDNRVENLRWFTHKQQITDNEITKERHKESINKANEVRIKKVINLDTNEIFESATEAARKYNLYNSSHIIACCKGKAKTAAKYRWSYYNKNQKGDD